MKRNRVLIATQLGILGGEEINIIDIVENLKDSYDFEILLSEEGLFTTLLKEKKIPFNTIKLKGHHDLGGFLKIFRILKSNNFDIIHIHSPRMAYYFLLANMFLKRKNLIWTHHVFIGDSFPLNTFKGRLYFWGLRMLMKLAQKNVCVSHYIKNKLVEHGINGENIEVVYNGIKTEKQMEIDENIPQKIRFGIMSRLEKYKGYPLLLRTLREYSQLENDFFVFNTGSLKDEIIDLSKAKENVHYEGFVHDKKEIFKKFDVLLLLSDFEGFGYVTIEAMLYGKPVIARDNALNREILKDYPEIGFIKEFTSEGLMNKIKEISIEKNYRTLLEYVKNFDVQRFDIKDSIKEIDRIYEEINENRC